jgi:bifunctional non-homologous end joining protein LigD
VQLWDRGTWTPQAGGDPARDLEKGHLKFEMKGRRMKGGWALIRLRDREPNPRRKSRHNWLLIKERDDQVDDADALAREVTSVKTGRTLEEIAERSRKVWHSNGVAKAGAKRKAAAAKSKKPVKKKRAGK